MLQKKRIDHSKDYFMDKKQIKNGLTQRSFGLTVMLCAIAVIAAADIEYGTHFFGHLLLMMTLGILSVIFMTCEKAVFVLDSAALVAIVFFTTNGSLLLSFFGLLMVLGAILLALAIHKKSAKTSAVLVVSATVTIGYLLVMAMFYAAQGNSLEIEELFSKLNDLFASIKVSFAEVVRQSVDSISEELLSYYGKDITKEMLLEASLRVMEDYVDWIQLILPGCCIFFVQVMGYIGVLTFEKTARMVHCEAVLPDVRWHLYPTQISCVIYIFVTVGYLIASLFSSTSSFTVIITNFWIALMPVMVACGFRSLSLRLKHPQLRKSTIFILILLGAGCLFIPDAVLTFGIFMLTFMGAQDVSLSRTVESGGPFFKRK